LGFGVSGFGFRGQPGRGGGWLTMVMTRSKYFMSAFSEYGYRLHSRQTVSTTPRIAQRSNNHNTTQQEPRPTSHNATSHNTTSASTTPHIKPHVCLQRVRVPPAQQSRATLVNRRTQPRSATEDSTYIYIYIDIYKYIYIYIYIPGPAVSAAYARNAGQPTVDRGQQVSLCASLGIACAATQSNPGQPPAHVAQASNPNEGKTQNRLVAFLKNEACTSKRPSLSQVPGAFAFSFMCPTACARIPTYERSGSHE